jgi:N-acetylglucosaminyl-diphospho-decaprenol L-rhamnosyltransferase
MSLDAHCTSNSVRDWHMKNNCPLVSIIIISFNEVELIGKCLSHILAQSYDNYEVIVYDNASSDGTPDYIAHNFPNIKLIRGVKNIGFGGANNEAAQVANGKYLAFINDDAYVAPGWLAPLVDILEADPSIGCAGPELMCLEKKDTILCHGNGIHLSGVAYLNDRGQLVRPASPMEVGGISGAAFLIHRDLFLELGGFEAMFFLYYEDTDLSLRLHLLGKRYVIVPGSMVYHNSESRFGLQKLYHLERNRYLSLFSLMSASMLALMAPSIFLFELISWGYCLLQGRDALRAKVRAWRDIYRLRPWIKARRSRYERKLTSAYLEHVFTPKIHIEYVHSFRLLSQIVRVVGYLVAVPSFLLARLYLTLKAKFQASMA